MVISIRGMAQRPLTLYQTMPKDIGQSTMVTAGKEDGDFRRYAACSCPAEECLREFEPPSTLQLYC